MSKRKSESAEDDRMKRLIICKLCHETLEDSIILPCGKTICSKHLLNETNNFKCNLCEDSHDKTVDKFPINEELNALVQICDDYVDMNSINFSNEYKIAKNQCKHLNDLINESELLIKDPAFYINDYFTKLRNEIDLSKEQKIRDITQKHEQIINELKDIECKCISETSSKQFNKLDDTIIEEKKNLMEWSLLLKRNLNKDSCCEDVLNESSQSISELKYEMNEFQVALLNNKQYKFSSIPSKDSIFGDLITNDAQTVSLIQTLYYHTDMVRSLTVLQNGDLASGSFDGTIKIWNPTTGSLVQTLYDDNSSDNDALTVLQNGNLVSCSNDYSLKIWNPTTGELIQTLTGHSNWVWTLTVLQNSNLVSGSDEIIIWNQTTGALIQTLTGHTGTVWALTVLKNGNLVSGSDDNTIKIWNPTTGALIQTITGHTRAIHALTVLHNGNLVSGSRDYSIKIWNSITGALIQTLTGHLYPVARLTILQNGNLVSGSNEGIIKIWNKTTGALIQTFTGHTSAINSLTVLQNGDLVSCSYDHSINIWG